MAEISRRFTDACCLHHQGDENGDGGRKHPWNVGKFLPDYTAQHVNRHSHARRRENLKSLEEIKLLNPQKLTAQEKRKGNQEDEIRGHYITVHVRKRLGWTRRATQKPYWSQNTSNDKCSAIKVDS
jgi:hypothetical protein